MKKIFFIAIYGVLFCFLSCTKKEKSDPSPVTVAEQNANDGTTLETIPEAGDGIMLRNCSGCGSCCCTLRVIAPANAAVPVFFCSSVFPGCGTPGCGCTLGNGIGCGSGVGSGSDGDQAQLEVGVSGRDFKEWCAGGSSVDLVIQNFDNGITVTYTIDCGGASPDTFQLQPLESALIKKNGSCTPTVDCIY